MKYYIIAGEASGDLHASNLIAEIKKNDAAADIRAWGGDMMKRQGATLVKHIRHTAFMGFAEVLTHLPAILRNIRECKKDILGFRPDALILVDYPGFNLRMAKFAHDKHIKVIYYISPQVWAWKRRRVRKIKETVDKMLVILPFEEEFFQNYGIDATYVGNPLFDALAKSRFSERAAFVQRNRLDPKREIIALLPGSRTQEVKRNLSVMLETASLFPKYQFVIAKAPTLDKKFYKKMIGKSGIRYVEKQTYDLLHHASAAVVTSGTATLETALLAVPEVVCYKANALSYHIARKLIRVKYISLVNLIMDKEVVKELIQNDLTPRNIAAELKDMLGNPKRQKCLIEDYDALRMTLGTAGASKKAAGIIAEALRSENKNG